VILNELEFPTVMYVHEAHARDRDLEIVTVPSPDGMTIPTEAMLAAIDEHTLVVPMSHVLFKSSYLQDARAIVERAHEVGAFVILDTYQSAGIVPFNVLDLDVDAATGGSVKWLCGGPGAGYLYVHPRWHDKLQPRVTGWMAHAEPFAFEPGAPRYAEGIARFLHGSPGVPALYSAQAGYEIVRDLGVDRIRAKNLRQAHLLFDLADAAGIRISSPRDDERRGGTVTLDVEHASAIVRELSEREILVDYRPGAGIRMSPHFYTTDDELRHAIDSITDIVETGSWREHDLAGAAY
jgi:kynureninase